MQTHDFITLSYFGALVEPKVAIARVHAKVAQKGARLLVRVYKALRRCLRDNISTQCECGCKCECACVDKGLDVINM